MQIHLLCCMEERNPLSLYFFPLSHINNKAKLHFLYWPVRYIEFMMKNRNAAYKLISDQLRGSSIITEMYKITCYLSFSASELVQSGRLMSLSVPAGDLNSLLPDEDSRRLYIGMKDHLLSTSLDDITQIPHKVCTHPHTLFLLYS